MSNVLALKFSNAEPDQLLGTLSVEEVMEVLKERVRSEVMEEVRGDYQGQIDDLECQLDEEGDWRNDAERWEFDAIGLYRAIEAAIELPWTEGLPLLRQAMADYGKDID